MEFVGLKNGEKTPVWSSSPSYTTSATIKSSVGEYEISAKATPKNYELSEISSGILKITKAPLTLQANDLSKTYYSEMPKRKVMQVFMKSRLKEQVLKIMLLHTRMDI